MRRERGISQKQMAAALGVTPSYLSALEHGRRGRPSWPMVQKIIGFFNVIWDEAEELQDLASVSDPRVTIDTAGLSPQATLLANRLSRSISLLDRGDIDALTNCLEDRLERVRKAPSTRPASR